jgi:hypothetical protein
VQRDRLGSLGQAARLPHQAVQPGEAVEGALALIGQALAVGAGGGGHESLRCALPFLPIGVTFRAASATWPGRHARPQFLHLAVLNSTRAGNSAPHRPHLTVT